MGGDRQWKSTTQQKSGTEQPEQRDGNPGRLSKSIRSEALLGCGKSDAVTNRLEHLEIEVPEECGGRRRGQRMRATVSTRHSSDDGYWRCKLQPFSTEHVEILAGQPFKKAEVRKGRRLAGQSAAALGNNPMGRRG